MAAAGARLPRNALAVVRRKNAAALQIDNLPGLGAVSYTHLDVYKRQVGTCAVSCSSGQVTEARTSRQDASTRPAISIDSRAIMAAAGARLPRNALAVVRRKNAAALQIDNLPGLGGRERDRVLLADVGIGAHEAMRLDALGCVLLDEACGLVAPVGLVGRGADAIAVVLDCRRRRVLALGGATAAGEVGQRSLELGEHRLPRNRGHPRIPDYRAGVGACRLLPAAAKRTVNNVNGGAPAAGTLRSIRHVDEDGVALDLGGIGLQRIDRGWRPHLARGHVEERLMDRALDAVAIEIAVGQQRERMRADVGGRVDLPVDAIERDALRAHVACEDFAGSNVCRLGDRMPSHRAKSIAQNP